MNKFTNAIIKFIKEYRLRKQMKITAQYMVNSIETKLKYTKKSRNRKQLQSELLRWKARL